MTESLTPPLTDAQKPPQPSGNSASASGGSNAKKPTARKRGSYVKPLERNLPGFLPRLKADASGIAEEDSPWMRAISNLYAEVNKACDKFLNKRGLNASDYKWNKWHLDNQ